MIVKVCGINYYEQFQDLQSSPVDMIGLNFYNKSKRYVIDDNLKNIKTINKDIVGVFVNESVDVINRLSDTYNLSYIQCHGHESVEKCKEIQTIQKIIKVFNISRVEDLLHTKDFEFADLFLFDTTTQEYGGSGKKFDWNILKSYSGKVPFLLAGGIGPDDIDEINQISHQLFAGVDINSKFEIRPGYKDLEQVEQFTKDLKKIV